MKSENEMQRLCDNYKRKISQNVVKLKVNVRIMKKLKKQSKKMRKKVKGKSKNEETI